jgi:hypothetical protein
VAECRENEVCPPNRVAKNRLIYLKVKKKAQLSTKKKQTRIPSLPISTAPIPGHVLLK